MENRGSSNDVDNVVKDSSGDGIQQDDVAEESSFNLPIASTASALSGSSLDASLQLPSASKVNAHDARDGPHGSLSVTKKLEHAPPCEPRSYPDFGMGDFATNCDVTPGAFPVGPSRNIGTSQAFISPLNFYDSTSEFANEESALEERVPNSAGAYSGAHGNSRMAAASDFYTVEGQRMPDGNEDGSVMNAEVQYITLKWYQRPLYRWIFVGLALFACGLVVAVAVLVVLINGSQSAESGPSLVSPTTIPIPTGAPTVQATHTPDPTAATDPPVAAPTNPPVAAPTTPPVAAPTTPPVAAPTTPPVAAPTTPPVAAPTIPPVVVPIVVTSPPVPTTTVTPVVIACKFLTIPNVTKCRSILEFDGATTGSTIPSAIGLLTQLTKLSFSSNLLASTIPSEIGLLTRLVFLEFSSNLFTSTIPSEIGLLTQLTYLTLYSSSLIFPIPSQIGLLTQLRLLNLAENQLTSTIPSEIGLLTQLTYLTFFSSSLIFPIPSQIGLLTQLRLLNLAENQLTSTIPSEIGLLTRLEALFLSSNELMGTIPSSLCSLPSLNGDIKIDIGEIACASGCCS